MTTIERIVPAGMRRNPVLESVVEAAAEPQKTTARVENTKEGMCPICHTQLRSSTANGLAVLYCADHSLVMPVRDPDPVAIDMYSQGNPSGLFGPDTSLC